MAIGTNTDPYQPIEKRYRIMREVLEVLDARQPPGRHRHQVGAGRPRHRHPVAHGRARSRQGRAVGDHARPQARPRHGAARRDAERRLGALRLSEAGVPTTVMVAPIIPALNESEIERILDAAAAAGAREAGYVLLRLPLEVRDVFKEFLEREYPDRAKHVMSVIRSMRGGKDYDSTWGTRMKGEGPYAWQIGRRFEIACRRLGSQRRAPQPPHRPVQAAGRRRRPVAAAVRTGLTATMRRPTAPDHPMSPATSPSVIASPGAIGTGTTQVPVVTNCPASTPPPYFAASLTSQVSAMRGSPSAALPLPAAASTPFL